LVIRAGHRLVVGELGQFLEMGEGALGLAAAKREGVLVNDYASWPGRMRRMFTPERRDLLGATIAYPLMSRGEVIGALSVAYLGKDERRFVPEDLDRLATLAAPAALAIEHSRLYDELASRVRQLQETQAQLVQAGKLSAVGQLVSGVAHELNNPLSVVIGYGQLLKGKQLPADVRGPLEMMVAQGERMAKIVQGLLLFSRQRKPERAPVDLPAVIEQTIALRATRLRLSGIRVEFDHTPGVPPAEGDVHQLQQVFLNLLLNAEHAIMTGGAGDTIRVRARERTEEGKAWVVVEFEDNGSGIAPEVMPRIFEPFFTTKKVGEGTGLGLSVSYGIVQQHRGRLTVESVPGRTVFTVELPSAAQAEPARQTVSPLQAGMYGFGRRALVVDDEPGMVDLVMALLKDTGWQVEVASTGRSALERVRAARFDVVLSDIRMPDGSGEDFYRAVVREQPALAKCFVFMTGDTANPSAWQFLEAEQVPVLEKPFTADSLFRVLERASG
jgi:signal transduction histidine kinase/CheY-like chemotaxis protein